VEQAATLVQQAVHPDALTIFGATFDEALDDEIRVTVIATGFDKAEAAAAAAAASPVVTPTPIQEEEALAQDTQKEEDDAFDSILRIFSQGNN
jgi:cell division protein FtsZ